MSVVAAAKALLLSVVLMALTAGPATGQPDHQPGSTDWLWTPGLCKSHLSNWGVRIDDGRTFKAIASYCAGSPEAYCEFNGSKYFYDHFLVGMVDGNGVKRTMTLHVTQEERFRVTDLRVWGRVNGRADARDWVRSTADAAQRISRRAQANCERV